VRILNDPNKVKIVGKDGCVQHHFSNIFEHGDLQFLLPRWIQH